MSRHASWQFDNEETKEAPILNYLIGARYLLTTTIKYVESLKFATSEDLLKNSYKSFLQMFYSNIQ